jgi:CTP synthase
MKDFVSKGYIISAQSNDKEKTAEMSELKGHPFFFGCQFHPEFSSSPEKSDGAFLGLIAAAVKQKK